MIRAFGGPTPFEGPGKPFFIRAPLPPLKRDASKGLLPNKIIAPRLRAMPRKQAANSWYGGDGYGTAVKEASGGTWLDESRKVGRTYPQGG